ncbi:MAG: hypothetical protein LAN59_14080 [Acidobacteriia bacterium]|nr:hypothetical protein [Terriglobia bacterium]
MVSDIRVFLLAVILRWQSYVTGGVLTALVVLVERLFDWKMPKKTYAALFIVGCLLVSFFLAWRDQYREALRVPSLEQQIANLKAKPPQIQVTVPTPIVNIPPQMAYMSPADLGIARPNYRIGGNIAASATCQNISPSIVAENAGCVRGLRVVETQLNALNQPIVTQAVQDKTYRQFQRDIASIEIQRRSYGPGEKAFGNVFSPTVDESLDEAFRRGSKTVLFLGAYSWKDGLGEHTNEICAWLQMYPDMFTGPGQMAANATITWNQCRNHNGLKK